MVEQPVVLARPPYLKRNDAPKIVNTKRIRDYLKDATFLDRVVYSMGCLLGIIVFLFWPLRPLPRFFQRQAPDRQNFYCRTLGRSRGIIQTYKHNGQSHTVRFYEPLRDSVDAPELCSSGLSNDRFLHYLKPQASIRHTYAPRWFDMSLRVPNCDAIVEEWDDQEKLVGIIVFAQRPLSLYDRVMTFGLITSLILRIALASHRTAYRLVRVFLALSTKEHRLREALGPLCSIRVLTVEKGFEKEHIGTALLESLMKHCDALKLPMLVKATSNDAVPFFEKFGFCVFEEFRCTPDAPPLFLMLRQTEPA